MTLPWENVRRLKQGWQKTKQRKPGRKFSRCKKLYPRQGNRRAGQCTTSGVPSWAYYSSKGLQHSLRAKLDLPLSCFTPSHTVQFIFYPHNSYVFSYTKTAFQSHSTQPYYRRWKNSSLLKDNQYLHNLCADKDKTYECKSNTRRA